MQLSEAMTRLERLGNESTLKTYRRHGVKGPAFGVRYGDLYKLQKEIGVDHALAQGLWKSGNHDARILATLVADPAAMSLEDLEAWHGDVDDYGLNDAVATVAVRSGVARQVAERWRGAKAEYRSAAGWHVAGGLSAPDTDVDDAWLRPLLAEIRTGIHAAPNRTRNAMNSVLISIGGYRPALRDEALAVAKAIGKVEVDHGDTSCKTPDAVEYIEKMAVRHSKKAAKKKTSAATKTAKPEVAPAKKTTSTKKTAAKKTSTKKTAAKKTAAKKTATKKAAATKTTTAKKPRKRRNNCHSHSFYGLMESHRDY
jgi:3-methyladenine DNA glycosylase AlkD